MPKNIKTVKLKTKNINIIDLLVKTKLAPSKSEAKRLVKQGAVEIDGNKISGYQDIRISGGEVIKVGKRKWVKLVIE